MRKVDQFYIRDYVRDFVEFEIKNEEIEDLLIQGGEQYLSPRKLANMPFVVTNFMNPSILSQNLYFKDEVWEISADEIKSISYGQIPYNLWKEQIISSKVKHIPNMVQVKLLDDGNFDITLSEEARRCHFLNFLLNASNMQWKKKKEDIVSLQCTKQRYVIRIKILSCIKIKRLHLLR